MRKGKGNAVYNYLRFTNEASFALWKPPPSNRPRPLLYSSSSTVLQADTCEHNNGPSRSI